MFIVYYHYRNPALCRVPGSLRVLSVEHTTKNLFAVCFSFAHNKVITLSCLFSVKKVFDESFFPRVCREFFWHSAKKVFAEC